MKHLSLAARYRPQTFAQVAGQDMVKAVLSRAERIASAARHASGEAYYADVQAGPQRCRAMVHPGSAEARRDCARNNTILRSIDAGRG